MKIILRGLFVVVCIEAVVGAATQASADDRSQVGQYGEPDRLVVRGADTFSNEQVKQRLLAQYDVLIAAHPTAPLAGYLAQLARQTLLGYRSLGFFEPHIRVLTDGRKQRVVVNIFEGQRFSNGEVRVVGAKKLSATQLVKRLTEEYPPKQAVAIEYATRGGRTKTQYIDEEGAVVNLEDPVWQPGKPVKFTEGHGKKLRKMTREALDDIGYRFAEFDIEVTPDPAKHIATLFVHIKHEGRPPVIDEVAITGNEKNTHKEILDYVKFNPGRVFTQRDANRINYDLWRSARFVRHEVNIVDPEATNDPVKLEIKLKEYPHAPRLVDEFSEVEKVLLRFRDWLAGFDQQQEELVIQMPNDTTQFVVSPHAGILFAKRAGNALRQPTGFDHCVSAVRGGAAYYSSTHKRRFVVPANDIRTTVNLGLRLAEEDEQGDTFSFSAGWGIDSEDENANGIPVILTVSWQPAAFLAHAYKDDPTCEINDGVLSIVSDKARIRIDVKTGRPLEYVWLDADNGEEQLRISVQHNALENLLREVETSVADIRNSYDANRPVTSWAQLVLDRRVLPAVLDCADVMSPELTEQLRSADPLWSLARRAVNHGVLHGIDELIVRETSPAGRVFRIPGNSDFDVDSIESLFDVNILWKVFPRFVLKYADDVFPRDSWPWRLLRATAYTADNRREYLVYEVERIAQSDATGPLGYLATATFVEWLVPKSNVAVTLAELGLKKMSANDFRNDYGALLNHTTVAGRSLRVVFSILCDLDDDEAELVARLFSDRDGESVQELVRRLRRFKRKPTEDLLPQLLDSAWQLGLRDQCQTALQRLQTRGVARQ